MAQAFTSQASWLQPGAGRSCGKKRKASCKPAALGLAKNAFRAAEVSAQRVPFWLARWFIEDERSNITNMFTPESVADAVPFAQAELGSMTVVLPLPVPVPGGPTRSGPEPVPGEAALPLPLPTWLLASELPQPTT